jgi:HPt (histidine-containing phosphotransfer) domain-containing protein
MSDDPGTPPSAPATDGPGALALPPIPGLDAGAMHSALGANARIWPQLLRLFHDGQRDALARIATALAAGDQDEARRHSHSLVSAAGNLGLLGISAAARELEDSLRHSPPARARIQAACARLQALLDPSLAAIAAWREQADAEEQASDAAAVTETPAANPERLARVLQDLLALAQAYDPLAEDLWNQERALLLVSLEQQDFKRLDRQMRDYNFTEAVELLKTMTQL